jgi:hypothetical protein
MQQGEWIATMEEAYKEYNVTEADRLPALLNESTLLPEAFPTEWEWCGGVGQDPSCTVSQTQEPESSVNAGAIAGFTILGVAILVLALYLWHVHRMKQAKARTEQRMRKRFVLNVARRITIVPSPSQIPVEKLEAEFDHIDKNKGGTIEKEELRTFLNEGKLGQVSDSDFEALWSAMDVDGTGEVDFLEFCTFLSGCGQEFDDVFTQVESMSKQERMEYLSRRFSGAADSLSASEMKQVEDVDVEKNGKVE